MVEKTSEKYFIRHTLTISVISETSTPKAVNGAPSLCFNAFFKCLLCEMKSEPKALVQEFMFANAPAISMPPIMYNAKRRLFLFNQWISNYYVIINKLDL